MGAGNVTIGVADDKDFVRLQVGKAGLAFGEGVAGYFISVSAVATEGAEFELFPEFIMAELELGAFGMIAGEEGEGGGGWMGLAVGYEFTDAGQGIVLAFGEKGAEALKVAGEKAGKVFLGWLDGLGGKDFAD